MIYNSLTQLIGRTPMLAIKGLEGQKANIVLKLEYFNPGGSVKDRVALSMIEDAESRGLLQKGATIVEPTSGNTGVGLAWVGSAKGYKVILTMPDTMSQERRSLLRALGATLVLTPGAKGMKGAIAKAEAIRDSTPGAVILGQFVNPANPAVHERTTGEEIWADTEGRVDIFVAGVGTGGTVSGTGKALKKHNPAVQVVAVEPASDDDAIAASRLLAAKEGLLVGISSGAAFAAALQLSREPENAGKTIVALLPDTGERYLSTVLYDFENYPLPR